MFRDRLLLTQLAVLLVLAALHVVALEFAFYWRFVWLDLIAHFLGGVWIAFAASWVAERIFGAWLSKWRVLSIVVLVAVAWEVFELWAGVIPARNYALDTTLDLLSGSLGGYAGYMATQRFFLDDTNK